MATVLTRSERLTPSKEPAGNVSLSAPGPAVEKVFVSLALAVMGVLALGSLRSQSLTINEIVDIPSGLSYWQKQDTRLNIEHPPLLKMLAAVPLLFTHVKVDYHDSTWCGSGSAECEWTFGKKLFEQWNADPQRLVILTRIPMVAVTLAMGYVLYGMGRRLGGRWGGGLSLALYGTSPYYLGLGPLVITDIGLPLFVLGAVWTFATLWEEPGGKRMVWFALSLAGALLSKFSALALLPVFLLVGVYYRLIGRGREWGKEGEDGWDGGRKGGRFAWKRYRAEGYAMGGILIAGLLVYCFYLFACWHSDSAYIFSARANAFGTHNVAAMVVNHLSWFLPGHPLLVKILNPVWLYLSGVLDVYFRIYRNTYVLGKWHAHGVWFYFPVVSFFKLAPGMLGCIALLGVLAAYYGVRWRRGRTRLVPAAYRGHLEAMIGALVVFSGSALTSTLNIGIRHFSVPLTIMVLLCALVVPLMRAVLPAGVPRRAGIVACGALVLSSLGTALLAYPHYISYYNFLRLGTPKQDIAANSNLYWGQSLIDLEKFRQEHHLSTIYVDSRTFYPDPAAYVPGAIKWECDKPDPQAPEWAAVTANFLLREAPTCAGLLRYPHWYISDESMVVFHVTDSSYASREWKSPPLRLE
jgi:hypothetical protein